MRRLVPVIVLGVLVGVLAGCGSPPPPPVDLAIPVNAKCTTCEYFIRCDGGSTNAALYDPSFDIYRLEPKGMLAQLATVWEFLVQLFHTRTVDVRPLSIYAQRPGELVAFNRTTTRDVEARTDLALHRIDVPGGWIDQVTGQWHGSDDSVRGACRLLTRPEGSEVLKLFTESKQGG